MALKNFGTNLTTSLKAMACASGSTANGFQTTTNIAIILNHIQDDLTNGNPVIPGSFYGAGVGPVPAQSGIQAAIAGGSLLYVPNRGVLRVLNGDYVAYDATTGWPILVSGNAVTNGPWTHT